MYRPPIAPLTRHPADGARETRVAKFVVELLTTNRHGGLVDKSITIRAASAAEARALAEARYQNAVVGYVGEESQP